MIHLIVNADDFGLSPGVNEGIVQAHACGIVTSASLMVWQPAAEAAAAQARAHPALGLGLHVDLGEWRFAAGQWLPVYERVPPLDAAAVEAEVLRQLDRFRALLGRDPDHFDSHQHVHQREPLRTLLQSLARRLDLPLRGAGRLSFCGDFYGQTVGGDPLPDFITVPTLLRVLDTLPHGVVELGCHPGLVGDDELAHTSYRHARNDEVLTLCHPQVRERLGRGDITLCTYAQAVVAAGGAW